MIKQIMGLDPFHIPQGDDTHCDKKSEADLFAKRYGISLGWSQNVISYMIRRTMWLDPLHVPQGDDTHYLSDPTS